MKAVVIEIKARGNLLLSLNNRAIPLDAPVWQKGIEKAFDEIGAVVFPAAFPLDDLDSTGLDVTVWFPGGNPEEDYTLTLLFNNDIALFGGKAIPADTEDNIEKNTRCFTLAAQYRPQGFSKVQGTDLKWRLVNGKTGETLELPPHPFELYWLYQDSGDLFRRGVPVEMLRDFTCHLEGEGHSPEKVMAEVVKWVFNRVPPRYDILHGSSYFTRVCGRLEFSFLLDSYLSAPDDPGQLCNCYDMANIVQAFLNLVGIRDVKYVFMAPYGYLKEAQLIGRGTCNNPFYERDNSKPVVPEDDPARRPFLNHAFCVTPAGMVLDACAGPHTGTKTVAQYIQNAIDTNYPADPRCTPGTAKDIYEGKGLVMLDQTIAPVELPDLPLTQAFMEELGISVSGFPGGSDKYVVFSWPDPALCPALADQPRSLFYAGIIPGQGEVIKTWKLKQGDEEESIRINIHIFSGSGPAALYRFIELGSAGSHTELQYKKGEPGLGQYSAQSAAPGINMRYFWVYYNMLVDISYHHSTADADAVNQWFRQQADAHLKNSIDADLPTVDDILCDNIAPKAGETITVTMKPLPQINHEFFLYGPGLRLRQEAPDQLVFQARSEGDVKLVVLAVDTNTLLMNAKTFDLSVQ
jgi:hypothetical protein